MDAFNNLKYRGEWDPGASWRATSYDVDPKDGVSSNNPVLQYCRGHISNGGCVLPGSLVSELGTYDTYTTSDTKYLYTTEWDGTMTELTYYYSSPQYTYTGEFPTMVIADSVVWAEPTSDPNDIMERYYGIHIFD